jgi:hypothetical protein
MNMNVKKPTTITAVRAMPSAIEPTAEFDCYGCIIAPFEISLMTGLQCMCHTRCLGVYTGKTDRLRAVICTESTE